MNAPRLVASDVDGTLLDPLEELTPRTAAAIAKVVASGTPFVLVTGRPVRWIPPVAGPAKLDGYAVCGNGAVVYHIGRDEIVSAHTLDPVTLMDATHALTEAMPGSMVAVERIGDGPVFATEHGYSSPWDDAESHSLSRAQVLGHPAIKLLVRHTEMTSDAMASIATDVLGSAVAVTFSSSRGLIEVSRAGVTKATGLAEVADVFGVAADEVVAFGDMPNDIEMLRWAGLGVAMANAHPDVIAVADEVTVSNGEDGVAVILHRWF